MKTHKASQVSAAGNEYIEQKPKGGLFKRFLISLARLIAVRPSSHGQESAPIKKSIRMLLIVNGHYGSDIQRAGSAITEAVEEFQTKHNDVIGTLDGGEKSDISVYKDGNFTVALLLICSPNDTGMLEKELKKILSKRGLQV